MILQPGDIAIDYSFARPSIPAMVAANVKMVCRYISPITANKKNLTAGERDALLAAGLSITLVWESGPTDPLLGAAKGTIHGGQARLAALALNYPADVEIIVAVDFDVQPAQLPAVLAYLSAFKVASSWPQGTYGKNTLIDAAHNAGVSTLGWQTIAWSRKVVSANAHCLQHATAVHPAVPHLGGVDDNTVLKPFKAWSTKADRPIETAPPPPPSQGDDMLRLLAPTDSPARFYAVVDPTGRALRCEWTGEGNDPAVAARLNFYTDATPAGQDFELAMDVAGLINVSLDGPLPPGFKAEQFANPDEIVARVTNTGSIDSTARAQIVALNDAVGRVGQRQSTAGKAMADAGAALLGS